MFTFINRFKTVEDMKAQMYAEKMGVPENEYLWDDLYAERAVVEELRKGGKVFRAVNTEAKPRKPPQYVLFVKGYKGDAVDAKGIEQLSSPFLRAHWVKGQDNNSEGLGYRHAYDSADGVGEDGDRAGGRRGLRRDGRDIAFDTRRKLANEHIRYRIEQAVKEIGDMTIFKTKSGMKRIKP